MLCTGLARRRRKIGRAAFRRAQPMIQAIKTVAVYVGDQQQALDFYTQKLGFEVRRRQTLGPQGDWIEIGPPGSQTGLVLYPRALMPAWKELKPSLVFQCENVEATCK